MSNCERVSTIWLTCALTLVAAAGQAQTLEFSGSAHSSVPGARAAVQVDVNRDGWIDVATANSGANSVVILFNGGRDGGFDALHEIGVGTGPFDIAAGDLNRDGIPDLVVATPDSNTIDVLLMRADGSAQRRTIATPGQSRGLTLADVSRDGILDLVYSDYARHLLIVLRGDGAGGFPAALASVRVSARPQGVLTLDVNRDGWLDVLVASSASPVLDLLYGRADGRYDFVPLSAGATLNDLVAADFDADGRVDVAAISTAGNRLVMFEGTTSSLVVAGTRTTGSSPRGLDVGDFNQDGRPDVAVANHGSHAVSVFLARRDGSVLVDRWSELTSGAGARALVTGDFDLDGRLDIAAGAQSAAQLWLHRNVTPFVAPALSFRQERPATAVGGGALGDFNENGRYDVLGARRVLLDGVTVVELPVDPDFHTLGQVIADYNRDGHQDAILAITEYNAVGQINRTAALLFPGNGLGQFGAPITLIAVEGESFTSPVVADFDRDGDLDLVTLSEQDLFILRQGSGAPTVSTFSLGASASTFRMGDINRDGILDVLAMTYSPDRLFFYPGTGTGSFTGPADDAPPIFADHFELGDMNHDGHLDVVIDRGTDVTVILASGGGTWMAPVDYPSYVPWDTGQNATLGDFNNDGHLDVFTLGGTLLFGDGRGALGPPQRFAIEAPNAKAIDWNRDGLLDFVNSSQQNLNERRAANRPPVANAGPDRTVRYGEQFGFIGEQLLNGSQSFDPDLHALDYVWRDHTGALVGGSELGIFEPRPPGGPFVFTLTVRDGRGGEDTDTVAITIAPDPEIVLHVGDIGFGQGRWLTQYDGTAASNATLYNPNENTPKVNAPLANPSSYAEVGFIADPTQTYKLWVRLKADDNHWSNDSVWMQFSGAATASGTPAYRIGTTSGLAINLEECSGCGISGWGWEDDGWGAPNVNGVVLRFPDGGHQRIRIQMREDGVRIDQIVLSADRYRTTRPGRPKNDTTLLPPMPPFQ
jgi:hypothetical protein